MKEHSKSWDASVSDENEEDIEIGGASGSADDSTPKFTTGGITVAWESGPKYKHLAVPRRAGLSMLSNRSLAVAS